MIDLIRTYYWHSNSSGADGTGWTEKENLDEGHLDEQTTGA